MSLEAFVLVQCVYVDSLLWCLCSGEAYIAIGGESYIGGVGTQREK